MARDPVPSLVWPASRRPSLILALLEIAVLVFILAAPLSVAAFRPYYPLVPAAVAAAYLAWALIAILRRTVPGQPAKSHAAAFMLAQFVGGPAMVGALGILGLAAWIPLAYRWEVVAPAGSNAGLPVALTSMAPAAIAAAILAAALFFSSTALLRRNDEDASAFFRRIRAEGIAILRPAAGAWLLLGLALLGLAGVALTGALLPRLLWSTNPRRIVDLEYLVSAYPGFATAVVATAVLTVAFRRMQHAATASLRQPRPAPRLAAVVAVIGSAVAVCGWYLHFLHIWVIWSFGAVSMVAGWGEISRATDGWIAAQQAAGRTPVEIAAELRDHGSWTTEAPGAGLPALLPQLGDRLQDLGLVDGCSVSVETGIADNSALKDLRWIEAYVAAFRPLPEISYCIRLACPSPVASHTHPVVVLSTSHPSRNRGWASNVFIDTAAKGVAPEAGGHCTATGELADSYQG